MSARSFFSAIFSCLLVYELVVSLAPRLGLGRLSADRARIIAVAMLATAIVSLLILAGAGLVAAFRHGGDSFPALLQKLAEVLENSRGQMPDWIGNHVPADADDLRQTMAVWLREHSSALPGAGRIVGHGTAHIFIGMAMGAMLALHQAVALDRAFASVAP